MESARQQVQQLSETKAHVEKLFQEGFLFRDENGGINMPASEEVRKQVAESARKPQNGSMQHQAFVFDSPVLGGNQIPVQQNEEAKRNLEQEFLDAQSSAPQDQNQ